MGGSEGRLAHLCNSCSANSGFKETVAANLLRQTAYLPSGSYRTPKGKRKTIWGPPPAKPLGDAQSGTSASKSSLTEAPRVAVGPAIIMYGSVIAIGADQC